ncbi:MAG: hypothetical protein FJX77_15045, partial [Armatimonadetes bacterium]|nr:hypothetical protein [Armatimonadota bacterium]
MTRLLQLLVLLTVLLSSLPRSSFAGLGSDRFRAGSFPAAPPPAVAPFDAATARRHQEAWARYLGQPVEHKNGLGQELVPLPPGELLRGSSPEQVRQAT